MPNEEIIGLTEFKNDGWIERLQHQPPVILTQNGKGRAVVQSYGAWQQSQSTLAMLKLIALADADVAVGNGATSIPAKIPAYSVVGRGMEVMEFYAAIASCNAG